MTEHQLEQIHNYTKYKVVEVLINKHQEGNTLSSIDEVEEVAEDEAGKGGKVSDHGNEHRPPCDRRRSRRV